MVALAKGFCYLTNDAIVDCYFLLHASLITLSIIALESYEVQNPCSTVIIFVSFADAL